jgi:D-arabinonate dehydratase/D-galactarolactone cycloisomerase
MLLGSDGATLQLLYAIPNGEYFECEQDPLPWRADILLRPLWRMEDGLVEPNDGPGLGIEIDESALAPWLVVDG